MTIHTAAAVEVVCCELDILTEPNILHAGLNSDFFILLESVPTKAKELRLSCYLTIAGGWRRDCFMLFQWY